MKTQEEKAKVIFIASLAAYMLQAAGHAAHFVSFDKERELLLFRVGGIDYPVNIGGGSPAAAVKDIARQMLSKPF